MVEKICGLAHIGTRNAIEMKFESEADSAQVEMDYARTTVGTYRR